MKKYLMLSILSFCILSSSCKRTDTVPESTPIIDTVSTIQPTVKADDNFMKAMNTMIVKMNAIKMTNDYDFDYPKMMIVHHQGAIDMALMEVETGTDKKIKAIAQNIIVVKTEEQSTLKEILQDAKPKKHKIKEIHPEMQNAMAAMMKEMKAIQLTGNTDRDFITMMIPHHEAGIEMSKSLFFHSKNTQLKKRAQKEINEYTKEVKEFQNWLSVHK
ncbi:DUF305 domain-containing protein [Flavobacterium sp. GT3R68]|uniref:DUF305 domain-containing protein n=1 Tax=Flavobacterium sp. GT3R68 TaxID=2594437 RepID=UPI000F8691EC|nr:DUF305 domain-containing protein [Flavobacterium sp. GT3R68]RTY95132.1 DUF305 domain-containing protein [Flavobacterium sp. GSN2]TRW91126.1 DUF305 domain-containing protein [Flavobacterium sp. GT3R68]